MFIYFYIHNKSYVLKNQKKFMIVSERNMYEEYALLFVKYAILK